ncbi:MAG: hypothetical protein ACETWM_09930 [Candidatus Lokiarchaeia archaeon]
MSLEKRLKLWIEEFDAYAGLRPPLFTNRLLKDPSLDEAMKMIGEKEKMDWPSLRKELEEMRSTYQRFSGFRLIIVLMLLVIAMGITSTLLIILGFSQIETEVSLIGAIPLLLLVIIIVFGDWLVYRRNMHTTVEIFRHIALEARKITQVLINRLIDIVEKTSRLKLYYSRYENTLQIGIRLAFNPIMTKKYLLELRRPRK